MRALASSTSSKIPGTGWLIERVAISPSTQGIWMRACVTRSFWSGSPKIVSGAGAGSVCHIASMAATFIFWFCVVS